MSIKSELIAARARIDTPEKRGYGEDRISTYGAFSYSEDWHAGREARAFLRKFLPDWARGSFTGFDEDPRTTHSDVMALFDRAIEEAV